MVSPDNWNSWKNYGALKDAVLNVTTKTKELVADNAKMAPKVKIEEALFSANLYEFNLENLYELTGLPDYASADGSEITVTGEAKGTGWTVGQQIALNHRNADKSLMDFSNAWYSVKADGVALTLDTDYSVSKDEGWVNYIIPKTAQTGVITVDYKYTPASNKSLVFKDVLKELATNRFKFVNTDSDGKEFYLEFFEGYNRAGIEFTRQPDEWDDAATFPIEIKAFPDSQNQLFRIVDEQAG